VVGVGEQGAPLDILGRQDTFDDLFRLGGSLQIVRTHIRSPRKLGVLTLAITLLLIQLGGVWHLAWNDHARCAEHGEWVDVASPTTATSAVQPSHGPQVDAAESSSKSHDHCTVVESSRVRGIEWTGGVDAPAPRSLVLPSSVRATEPDHVGFALYLLAPKHGPPC
jgi:hypothetical protein